MKKILFLLLAILFAIQGYGQTVQTSFGTTTQSYIPIYTLYGYNYSQQIVTNAELVAGGLGTTYGQITKIRWHWNGSGSFENCYNWKIFIGHTTKTAFSSSSDWEPVTNLTVVFDSLITIPTTAGWMEVNLQTPFTYNGTDNLIIAVDENTTSFSSTAYFTSTSGYTNRGIYYRSDSTNPDPASPPTGTRVSTVPNIQLYFYETCPSPGNLTASNVSHENATISWTPTGTETMWNLEYKMSSDATWTLVSGLTSPSYTLTSLTPNTTYNVRVQADCGTDQSAFIIPINFTTLFTAPATFPYSCDFENPTENAEWAFINGTQTNKFFIGDASFNPAVNNTIGGSNALYISNDNGATWAYSGTGTATNSWVYAYRDFEVPAGVTELKLDFDWIANGGVSASEFLRVYWMPTNIPITAGNLPPTINTVNYDLAAMIGNYTNGYGQHWLSRQTTWQHSTFTINTAQYPNLAGNIWRLYVHWRNNQSTAVQPPATFDNMSLVVSSCLTPLMDSIVNITQTSANIHFTENGSAATWNVQYRILGNTNWSIASGSTNPFIINGLQPSTSYEVRMQSDCSFEQSAWTPVKKFNTACGTITQIPWVDYFDNYGTGTTVFPPCWTRKTTQSDRPYITSINFSSPGSMYMFADIGAYNIASTPMFDISIPINTLQLNFKYRTSNATDTLLIGVMTDPQDSSTFVPVSFVTASSTGVWFDKEVPLNSYIGTGQYIAFKIENLTSERYAYIDNLVVSAIPSCPRPYQLTASNPTVNSIDLNWIEVGTATQWEVEYGAPGFVQGTGTTEVVSAIPPYIVTGLNSATTYDFYIRSICGTDYSPWSLKVSATTACGVFALPFTQNFDSASFPVCWSQTYSGALSSNRWSVNDESEAGGTPNEMECGWQDATGISRLISPAIDFTNIVNPILSFKHFYSDYAAGATLKIQTSTDMITWVDQPFSIISGSGDVGPATVEIVLANLTGVNYIAWVVDGNHYQFNQWYIDNVFIQEAPSCPNISLLSVVSSTSTDITLNWTFSTNANQGFELAYSNVSTGFDPNTPENTITIPDGTPLPYTIPSLTAAQFYSFAVRQACNGAWSNIVVTNTDGLPAQVPYTCDFSDIIEKASWKISNGNATNKFFIGTPSNNVPPVVGDNLFISDTEGATNNYNTDSPSTAIASRLIEFSGDGGYVLNFDLIIGGESSYDYIKVFLTDPDTVFVGSNSKPYYAINSYNGNNQLMRNYNNTEPYFNGYNATSSSIVAGSYPREIILPFQGPAGTVKRLIILWTNDSSGGTQPPASIDNIVIQALTCPIPIDIATSNLTTTSADINWIDPSSAASEWIVKWKPVSATTWDIASSYTTTYSLTNLTINTPYNVSIATVCGSDTSIYADFYFATPCDDITIPYTQNFDSATGFPTCWTRKQGASNPATSTTYSVSPSNSLYFYASSTYQYAATPPVDINVPVNTLQVIFKLYRSTASYVGAKVGVMTDPNDFSTFEQIGSILSTNQTGVWEEKIVNLNTYTGNGRYIVIVCDGQTAANGFYLDDFEITVIPSCPKPQFLTATTTDQTALLSWTETGSATAWEIEWGLSNFVQGQGTLQMATDTFLPLSNLTQNTTYKYFVRSICGVGDTSLWSGPFTFSTQVLNTIPNLEPFLTTTTPVGYNTSGWTIGSTRGVTGNPGNNIYKNIYSTTTVGQFNTANYGPIQSNTVLTFDYKVSLYSSPYGPVAPNSGSFIVAVSTDWGSTYVNVDTVVNNGIAGYQSYSYDLSAYNNEIVKIRIIGTWVVSDYDLGIDNIYVGPAITCPTPSALVTSNPSTTSIDLGWTENGTATEWQIEYGLIGFTPGTGSIITAISNPFTLTSLTPSTCYDFYVQAVCSPTDLSMWSNKGSFCTAQIPVNSPVVIDFETPSGFQVANNPTGNSWFIGSDAANTVNNTTGGQNALFVTNDNGTNNAFTITTAAVVWAYRDVYFTPSADDYTFSFDWKGNGEGTTTAYDYLSVYIGSPVLPTPSTTSTITAPTGSDTIVTKLRLQPTWQTSTHTLPAATYSGQTKRIFFMWRNDGSGGTQPPAAVDNISITTAGQITCDQPTNVTVSNISANSATVTWTPGATETEWELDYKLTSASTWTTVLVATNPTTNLSTLLPASNYDVRVRAKCDATTFSDYSAVVNFTTTATPCDPPTNVTATNITDNSATITWTVGGTETSWQVEYKMITSTNWTIPAAVTAPTIQLQGLQNNTTYDVRVKALCNPGESAFATAQFTTTGGVITFTITASASGPGTITPSGDVQVLSGADQNFTFTPNANSEVTLLTVNGITIPNSGLSYNFSNVTSDQTIHVTFGTIGIEEGELAQMVQLYPNPTNATIEIRLDEAQLQVRECRIYDIYGKLMNIVPVTTDVTKIDVTDFAAGVYFIRMNSEMGTITKKFVKK